MEQTNRPIGRREAHKRATREELRTAARQLFAAQGYEATTVREIARAAGVTERTFYRYFDGKEALLAEQARSWIDRVEDAIGRRPAEEPPFAAVREALLAIAPEAAADLGSARFWQPEMRRAARIAQPVLPRPWRLLEDSIAAAIRRRLERGARPAATSPSSGPELEAELLARVAVAALRTAVSRHRGLQRAGGAGSPGIELLVRDAFRTLVDLVRTPGAGAAE